MLPIRWPMTRLHIPSPTSGGTKGSAIFGCSETARCRTTAKNGTGIGSTGGIRRRARGSSRSISMPGPRIHRKDTSSIKSVRQAHIDTARQPRSGRRSSYTISNVCCGSAKHRKARVVEYRRSTDNGRQSMIAHIDDGLISNIVGRISMTGGTRAS